MASTNHTTNYNLSQFIGADKPAWLGDYNSDMGKIDTGIHNAQTTATGADGKADSNATAIGTLANLTTTAKTSLVAAINEVDSNADTAQNTATSAGTLANTAKLTADSIASQLNLNTIKADNHLTFSPSAGSFNGHDGTVVRNTESSLCKIYGTIYLNGVSGTGDMTVTITGTGINVDSPITINNHGFMTSTVYQLQQAAGYAVSAISIVISNDTITITLPRNSQIGQRMIYLSNSLLFLKDFGDVTPPEPEA